MFVTKHFQLSKISTHIIVSAMVFAGLVGLSALSGCSETDSDASLKATARVEPTESNRADGQVTFTQLESGVKVTGRITGLLPGKHGFHIHENGDCGNNAKAAGGHFNPENHQHGSANDKSHMGDLGNITANASGAAVFDFVDPNLTLKGNHTVVGRSVVVHEKADDLTSQPSGAAGSRVGCGVISDVTTD